MPDERTPPFRGDRDDLIKRQQHEITRLRDELARTEQRRREVERERDRLKRQNERLKQQLDAARRAGFRQAAPFAKDRAQGRGGRPGRRAGAAYGRRARRPRPRRVDETYTASLPPRCPDCGGAVHLTRVAPQYQEDLPVVRPVVRRFDVEVGCCAQCGRRVHGRHPLQTSDALGAANVHLGPGQGCPVIEMANRCNELSRHEIRANSHRNDIFLRRAFSDKNGAPDPPQQNGGCHRAAPSSLS